MSVHSHRHQGPRSVSCAVITVSDSRTPETDTSGMRIRTLLNEAGHEVVDYRIVKDEPSAIHAVLADLADTAKAVIFNGGTGLARRDTTFEALESLLVKRLDGFGELFRMLSWEDIGAAAMLSRATAGVIGHRIVFSLPGSTAAVELGMTKLILPELGHVVGLLRE